jgi:hypothetical protein
VAYRNRHPTKKITEDGEPEHLLKEYELCWQGVQHHNERLWTSASIFVSGGIIALTWLGTRPLAHNNWVEFSLTTVIAFAIGLVLWLYLRIFSSWEVLDRVEFYRAEEIEKHLKLWRIRYRLRSHEQASSTEEDSERLNVMRQIVAGRLNIPVENLPSRRKANKAFRAIIWVIIIASGLLIMRALTITLGLLN